MRRILRMGFQTWRGRVECCRRNEEMFLRSRVGMCGVGVCASGAEPGGYSTRGGGRSSDLRLGRRIPRWLSRVELRQRVRFFPRTGVCFRSKEERSGTGTRAITQQFLLQGKRYGWLTQEPSGPTRGVCRLLGKYQKMIVGGSTGTTSGSASRWQGIRWDHGKQRIARRSK